MASLIKKRAIVAISILFLSILLFAIFHAPILNGLAKKLVRKDTLAKSDAIVVLAGDRLGERMETAIDLYKKGYGKKIVFWGGIIYWKIPYAELYLRQIKESGVPVSDAIWSAAELPELSTRGEAEVNISLLNEHGLKSFILVTSPFHTARAARVYDSLAKKHRLRMLVCPSKDSMINLDYWWRDRQSAKVVYLELNKTLYYFIKN